ncbi:NAD-dependent epimerase/dehydratase family protein [Haloarchaeobius sp. HME9146]|uniref:NAD-dependent epimerase/dehydratase family protein n=1 Tax=Haloarchaeobius sp. HME9146 TaxID=2978732 RepID=UPI0021C123D2|nr:NAD-dependent epimerase/dehydratase family protein [Haloarchaeobius sp. HME9146]MCT9094458.1 NAD-dependent epimerase/dehydratase family protein [Haloarchaeobius sp. HME9146]
MPRALLVGGTRFIGRHTVSELLAHDYTVTTFSRGKATDPFADTDGVSNYQGDRNDRAALEAARDEVDPDIVIDFVGMFPEQIATATEVFADVDAYVFVSSGSAYGEQPIPMREDEIPLCECTPEQATDESMASYGPRKAECDREVFDAADRGVNAMSVRPMLVHGPHDYTQRTDYWLHRLEEYDRVLVPGDGDSLLHRAYVADVGRALRIVAERGEPGEAYNVADREATTLAGWLELAAEALDTEVKFVYASERELAATDLSPSDFPLFTDEPMLVSTEKLAALGWDSTPLSDAYETTVAEHLESERDGTDLGPAREAEEAAIDALGPVESDYDGGVSSKPSRSG